MNNFARKHRIKTSQARELIEPVGNDREKLNAATVKLKGKYAEWTKSGRLRTPQ